MEEAKKEITLDEILKDELYENLVHELVERLRKERKNRKPPKPGFRYRRDAIDRLFEQGNMNTTFIMKHIEDVWHKRSKISSQIREFIQFVGNNALFEYYKLKTEEAKEQEETKEEN